MAYPSQNIPSLLGTFVDGSIVTAGTTAIGDTGGSTLNPKMELIRSVVNDHADKLNTLNAQVSALGGLVYNVVAYGADPTGVADSTSAIQSAVSAAVANQGIVIFSNGIYKLTDTITISGTCYITSDGAGQGVTLFQTTVSKSFFNISSSYVRITDLKMDFQGASATNAMIYRATPATAVYLSGIVIQRCQFYSTTSKSFTAISLPAIQASSISDCTTTGSATITVNFVVLNCPQNVIIARNFCTSCATSVALSTSISGGTTLNIIIEQNTITAVYADAISTEYCSNVFINNNYFKNFRSTTTVYYAVKTLAGPGSKAEFLNIVGNLIDNNGSASSTKNGGIYARSCAYLNISRNNFIYGYCPIYIAGRSSSGTSHSNINILDNILYRPFDGAIYTEDFFGTCAVRGNTIIDVVSNTSSTDASAIRNTSVSSISNCMLVSNNSVATDGITGYTYKNSFGYFLTNGSSTQRTVLQGNDLVLASSPFSATSYTVAYEDINGLRTFNAVSAAPTSGTWKVGDKVILSTPTAGGYIGYVCTTAGSPGTWKGFGAIQA